MPQFLKELEEIAGVLGVDVGGYDCWHGQSEAQFFAQYMTDRQAGGVIARIESELLFHHRANGAESSRRGVSGSKVAVLTAPFLDSGNSRKHPAERGWAG